MSLVPLGDSSVLLINLVDLLLELLHLLNNMISCFLVSNTSRSSDCSRLHSRGLLLNCRCGYYWGRRLRHRGLHQLFVLEVKIAEDAITELLATVDLSHLLCIVGVEMLVDAPHFIELLFKAKGRLILALLDLVLNYNEVLEVCRDFNEARVHEICRLNKELVIWVRLEDGQELIDLIPCQFDLLELFLVANKLLLILSVGSI